MKPPPAPEAGNRSSERSHDRSCDRSYDQRRLVAALADPSLFGPECAGVRASRDAHLARAAHRRARVQDQEAGRPGLPRLHVARRAQALLRAGGPAQSPARAGSLRRRRRDHGQRRPPGRRRRRARARVRGQDARVPAGRAREPHARTRHADPRAPRRAGGGGRGFPRPRRARRTADAVRVARHGAADRAAELHDDPAAARRPAGRRAAGRAARVDRARARARGCPRSGTGAKPGSSASATATFTSATSR